MRQFQSVLEPSSLDGASGFQINGEALGDKSGQSVASVGYQANEDYVFLPTDPLHVRQISASDFVAV